jgi:hypothetical protein
MRRLKRLQRPALVISREKREPYLLCPLQYIFDHCILNMSMNICTYQSPRLECLEKTLLVHEMRHEHCNTSVSLDLGLIAGHSDGLYKYEPFKSIVL